MNKTPVVRPLHRCEFCGWDTPLQATKDPHVFVWMCFHGHSGSVAYSTANPPPVVQSDTLPARVPLEAASNGSPVR